MTNQGEDSDFSVGRFLAGGLVEGSDTNQGSPHDNGSFFSEITSGRDFLVLHFWVLMFKFC